VILEIDAGNTFIKWRLVCNNTAVQSGAVRTSLFGPESFDTLAEYAIQQVLAGSVAGVEFERALVDVCERLWSLTPLFARTQSLCGRVKNSYADPSKMGIDRWLAMVAAYDRAECQVIVVDCGSAITIDFVSKDGQHDGGYIIPGLRLMQESLLRNTAQVRFDESVSNLLYMPGTNTAEAVMHGAAFTLNGLALSIRQKVDAEGAQLFITGGDGALFHKMAGVGQYLPDLVLEALPKVCLS